MEVTDKTPPLEDMLYADVDFDEHYSNYPTLIRDIEQANVITSKTNNSNTHKPVLDIDLPIKVIESSPGKHHLYIDKEMTWDQYSRLLLAMTDAGILEDGYVRASLERGFTALRLPWIKKETTKAKEVF
jgi:hypothetical protein